MPAWEPVWQGEEAAAEVVRAGLEHVGVPARAQGVTPVAGGFPTAFARDTWAVFVPSKEAARARAWLDRAGEGAGIVEGLDSEGLTAMQRQTLRFAVYGAAALVLLGLAMAVRAAM